MQVYIEDIAAHEGQTVTIRGWLANRRSSGKIHFLQVRDGSGFIQAVMSKAAVGDETFATRRSPVAGERHHRARARCAPTRARPGGYEIDVSGARDRAAPRTTTRSRPRNTASTSCMDRRHLWIRSARQQAVLRVRHEVIDAVRDYFNSARLHPRRHADLHAVGLRGHDDAVSGAVLRRPHGVPDAERTALQRGQRDGARTRLLLRPDVPRREVEDAPAPDRVLDGRARGRLRHARRHHRARRRARRRRRRSRARTPRAAN